jgi:hypothetical protein
MTYWTQYADQIKDMHGIDDSFKPIWEIDSEEGLGSVDCDDEIDAEEENECPRCRGGCNYCLML